MLKFVDRKQELESLERFYRAPGAGLLIMSSRRRVGKTRPLTLILSDIIRI